MTTEQLQFAKEIAAFGTQRGYDMENLTPSLLNKIMKHWLEVGKDFYEKLGDLPINEVKPVLNVE